jgi:hypothetical protein
MNVNTEIFTDICGKSSMSDGLVEISLSASGEIFMVKKTQNLE